MKSGWLPFIGLACGFALGYWIFARIPGSGDFAGAYSNYLSLATLAGLDTVLGGVRSGLEGKFKPDIFASGFMLNTLLAALLAWFGDKIGVDLFLAAVVAMGTRVFLNISLIRRNVLTRGAMKRDAQSLAPIQMSPRE